MRNLLLCFAIAVSATYGRAEPSPKAEGLLNKLLAPGPLIAGHKALEHTDCLKCHVPGKGVPDSQCLECHKEIRAFVEQKKSLHGLATQSCAKCHPDHRGRDFDSTIVDPRRFDHKTAGFALEGKHGALKCSDCHTEKRSAAKKELRPDDLRFIGLKTTCVSCHKKHDPHRFVGKFADKDCGTCHGLRSWKAELTFNHAKDGRFELQGKHAQLKCAQCHLQKLPGAAEPPLYQWPALPEKKCLSCHENTHQGRLSARFQTGACTTCHGQASWKIEKFDHGPTGLTNYPLKGRHVGIDCIRCHRQEPAALRTGPKAYAWNAARPACESCHQSPHLNEFSKEMQRKACASCHTDEAWKQIRQDPAFNHDRDTRFKLTGKHAEASCAKCHAAPSPDAKPVFRFPTVSAAFCIDCHKSPHAGQFSRRFDGKSCAECHSTTVFATAPLVTGVPFNHGSTAFALRGKHATLACAKCHVPTDQTYSSLPKSSGRRKSKLLFPDLAARDCATCHKDPHQGNFGARCSDCHGAGAPSWKRSRDFHRGFTLSGVHYSLECSECHQGGRRLGGMSENCSLCHQKDDIHNGRLPQCGSCHRQQFWENPEFRHSLSNFPLRGAHRTLDCNDCHANGIYRGTPTACASCHLKDAMSVVSPPHVPGFIQRDCAECHKNQFSF